MTGFASAAATARTEMRTLFPETPLQRNDFLSKKFNAEIFLKREDLAPVRSYKIRGAFNAIRKSLDADPRKTTFVCASAGNHAQGVAFVCRHFGVNGAIFMPITTPKQKVDKTRAFGGDHVDISLLGDYFEDTLAAAQKYCAEKRAVFLPPFDHLDVIEGQATVAVELVEQLGQQQADLVILPVGGGGLAAGVVQYMRHTSPKTSFKFVEPEGAASLSAALAAGKPSALPQVNNFVDGAAVAKIGDQNFAVLADIHPSAVLAAPENRICTTIQSMLNIEGIVLEPAGALSIDVLEDLRNEIAGTRIVCVTSGGNFDFERLPDVKERALRYSGLKKYVVLRLPQRPGALREFLGTFGPDDDIVRFEYLKKSARNFGSVLIGIETKVPDGFKQLFERMERAGFSHEDITDNDALAQLLI